VVNAGRNPAASSGVGFSNIQDNIMKMKFEDLKTGQIGHATYGQLSYYLYVKQKTANSVLIWTNFRDALKKNTPPNLLPPAMLSSPKPTKFIYELNNNEWHQSYFITFKPSKSIKKLIIDIWEDPPDGLSLLRR
jgi:hypothetical protein